MFFCLVFDFYSWVQAIFQFPQQSLGVVWFFRRWYRKRISEHEYVQPFRGAVQMEPANQYITLSISQQHLRELLLWSLQQQIQKETPKIGVHVCQMIENPTKKFLLLKKDKKVLKVTHEQRPRRAGALSSPYPLHLSMAGQQGGKCQVLFTFCWAPTTSQTPYIRYFISSAQPCAK